MHACISKRDKAYVAQRNAAATLAERRSTLAIGSDNASELRKMQRAVASTQVKLQKANEKVQACEAAVIAAENAVEQARNDLDDAITQFPVELAQFLARFTQPAADNQP